MNRWRSWIFGSVGVLLSIVGLAAWAAKAKRTRLDRKARESLDKAIETVGKLTVRRKAVATYLDEHHTKVRQLDREIAAARREAVEVLERKPTEALNAEEIKKRYDAMGL